MEHLRKIKKMKESQIQKQLAMSEMVKLRKSKLQPSNITSFLNKKQQQIIDKDKNVIYTIKNLDQNKIQFIDKEEKVNKILQDIDELPQLEKLLQKLWNDYLNEKQKQEEQFLQACYQGNFQRVKKILTGKSKHPIDPRSVVTAQGKNGIHLATISGSYKRSQIIAQLIKENVDINGRTFLQKRTPLMLGSILGNEIAVKALIENDADMTLQDFQGNTALHLACIFNQEDIIQLLSDYNPPVNVKNIKGYLPFDYIKERNVQRVSLMSSQNQNQDKKKEKQLQ